MTYNPTAVREEALAMARRDVTIPLVDITFTLGGNTSTERRVPAGYTADRLVSDLRFNGAADITVEVVR